MVLINGLFTESVPVQDRGLHYGDGLFETIAIRNEKPLCWEAHYHRLQAGCARLAIPCPAEEVLRAEMQQLPVRGERGVAKIIVTRGSGGRGYRPPDPAPSPTRILGMYPWPDYPPANSSAGIKARICSTRLGMNPRLAGIKHLNRLEQVLARGEWNNPDIAEGLMLDTGGGVIEGTMSNLFCVMDHALVTPDLSACGVAGIIRGCILALADQLGMQISVRRLTETELYAADELFLCNSVIGIWPVREIEHKSRACGPWTQKIRALLLRHELIAA